MLDKRIFRKQRKISWISNHHNPFGDPVWEHPSQEEDLKLELEIDLGVLGVRQNCWADLEALRVPSNTELTHSILNSLGLFNIFLSLRQWGSKAVCKTLGFFLWCYFYSLFVGFVKPVLVLQEHWLVCMGVEFDSEVKFIFFQWKLRVST